jgi:hypothetical protein
MRLFHGVYPERDLEILRFAQNDKKRRVRNDSCVRVNPSTPQPEGWGMLMVDPERRFSTRLQRWGVRLSSRRRLGAVERVNFLGRSL